MKFAALRVFFLGIHAVAESSGAASHTASPVEKIVSLLQDLQASLETEAKEDVKIYNRYACWCESTSKRKAKEILNGAKEMRALSQTILMLKGKVATLTSEIKGLSESIAEIKKQQETHMKVRQKQNEVFMSDSSDMKNALAAMQKAIQVLAKASMSGTASSMIQEGAQVRMRAAVQHVLETIPSHIDMPLERLSLLSTFTAADSRYAPQSATIQGILVDMYTTFASDLESVTLAEASDNKNYEAMMANLEKMLKEDEKQKTDKEAIVAKATSDLAEATSAYDDTKKQKEADIAFFDETKKACTAKAAEMDTRKNLRAEELMGVRKAIAILTTDEARETFESAIGDEAGVPSDFLQISAGQSQAVEMSRKAYTMLRAQATKTQNFRIAMIAVSVRNAKVGHFEPVIKAIDSMLQALKDEDSEDIAKRDECIDEYQAFKMTSEDLSWKIEVNEAMVGKLEAKQKAKQAEKEETIAEIGKTKADLAALKTAREEEHAAFLKAKKDDEEVIRTLSGATNVLSMYYKEHGIKMGPIQGDMKGPSLYQSSAAPEFERGDKAPDATLSGSDSHKLDSKGIISMLTRLIEDAQDEIKNNFAAEEAAKADYEAQQAAGLKLIEDLTAKKTSLEIVIAKAEEDKLDESELLDSNTAELDKRKEHKAEITTDCDHTMAAFSDRADARAAEMEGLTKAKEYLAGAQSSFLQKSASVRRFLQ